MDKLYNKSNFIGYTIIFYYYSYRSNKKFEKRYKINLNQILKDLFLF